MSDAEAGRLTHFDERGQAVMVDVGGKPATARLAIARGKVFMHPSALALVAQGGHAKGDVLGTARLAGIMAAKRASDLIPLCHPLALSKAAVDFAIDETAGCVVIEATVALNGTTGAEMEALTAVSVAALTIYDMCKAVDKAMTIADISLVCKQGGKSGDYRAAGWSGPLA
jgi:cyclic pyranopterin monophosphate synthase